MDPGTDKDWSGAVSCCGVNNRGVALWQDKVVSHTLDGRLIATDKATGEVAWERQVADPAIAEVITVAPLVVRDLAITGVSGAEYGIRGWLAATDLNTGEEVWRRHTIPAPGEPGHDSWADQHDAWKTGGGSTWVTGSYDPEQDLIIWGVGNPGPDWDAEYRPGDNLYTNSAIALDPETGEIKWHYQYTPNDPYDYDGVAEHVLVDTEVDGAAKKLALHADRNGFAYALDRTSGEFVWGTQFVKELTWTRGLDKATGLPLDYDPQSQVQTYVAGTAPSRTNPVGTACPGNMGGKNWPPTAYHAELDIWYIPVIESCNEMTNDRDDPGRVLQAARVLHRRRAAPAPADHRQRDRDRRQDGRDRRQARDRVPDARRHPRDRGRPRVHRPPLGRVRRPRRQDAGRALALRDRLRDQRAADHLLGRRQAVRSAPGRPRRRLAQVVRRQHRGAGEAAARPRCCYVFAL